MLNIFLALALCFGCANDRANAWVGHKLDDLIRAWGPPTSQAQLSDGSKIVEWTLDRTIGGGGYHYPDGSGGTWTARPINYRCRARMEADAQGVITRADVKGDPGGCNMLFADKERPGGA